MNYQQLLQQAQDYVFDFYKAHDTSKLFYHNQQHTEDVLAAATQIANHYQLNDHDFFIVQASAWFHDLGYMVDITDHEEKGIVIAEAYYRGHQLDEADIALITGCIRATKMPQSPTTALEQIICDADLFHLGQDDFFKKDKQLHQEIEALYQKEISKQEWRLKTIVFLQGHQYHTDYCQLLLNGVKDQNLAELKNKAAKSEKKAKEEQPVVTENTTAVSDQPLVTAGEAAPKSKKKDKGKDNKPEKGIETMFRITSGNNQRLSDMADKKAHILITVNSIILSAIISLVLKKLDENGFLAIPSFILLTVSLLSMIFSILATRPSIPPGTFNQDDLDQKKVNLLFFGNFYRMGLDAYTKGMQMVMNDSEFLYDTLIRDVYSQGVVLGRKYRLLRIAYNIFMFGLVVAVVAFIISSIIHNRTDVPHR